MLDKFKPYSLAAALLFAAVAGIAAHSLYQMHGVLASEDNVLFYMNALNLTHEGELRQFNDRAIDYYGNKKEVQEFAKLRLNFRANYLNEFPAMGVAFLIVGKMFITLANLMDQAYPLYLSQVLVVGFFLSFLIVLGGVIGVLSFIGRKDFAWGFAAAVVVGGISGYFLVPSLHQNFATILLHPSVGGVVQHLWELFIYPSTQFSPLSFTPRSNLALFLVAVFAFRWSGYYPAAYLFAGLGSFMHLSSSGMILVILLFIDALMRPQIFKRPVIVAIVSIILANFFIKQTMWVLLGDALSTFSTAIGILIVLIVAFASLMVLRPKLRECIIKPLAPVLRLRERVLRLGPIASDLIVFVSGWALTFILMFLGLKMGTDLFSKMDIFNFWGRVHGRVLMLMWLVIVFAGFSSVAARVLAQDEKKTTRLSPALGAVVIIGTLIMGYEGTRTFDLPQLLKRLTLDFNVAETRISQGPMLYISIHNKTEMFLYYAMCKSVDTSKNVLDSLLK